MSCDKSNNDCLPCKDCPEVVAPIEPRCNVVLTDGTFTNATVHVEDGCIVLLENGEPLLYSPDACCSTAGGSSSGSAGLQGEKGAPGENATITIGTVTSLASTSKPTVTNTGSDTNAVLNFGIPRGEKGDAGDTSEGTTYSGNGVTIKNGIITDVPLGFPGPSTLIGTVNSAGYSIDVAQDATTGVATLSIDLTEYNTALWKSINEALATRDSRISALEEAVNSLTSNLASLTTRVSKLESK